MGALGRKLLLNLGVALTLGVLGANLAGAAPPPTGVAKLTPEAIRQLPNWVNLDQENIGGELVQVRWSPRRTQVIEPGKLYDVVLETKLAPGPQEPAGVKSRAVWRLDCPSQTVSLQQVQVYEHHGWSFLQDYKPGPFMTPVDPQDPSALVLQAVCGGG